VSVSCASAGNCSAAGDDGSSGDSAFVVDKKHGIWGRAERVPGLAALTGSEAAGLSSLSCTSAGNCIAYGTYDMVTTLEQGLIHELAFVVSEKDGKWGTASAVPGLAALDMGGMAAIESLSCGSAGNCSAGGFYNSFKGSGQAFLVTEKHGTWGRARQVPGLSRLAQSPVPNANVSSVSCGSAGNCSAGGSYGDLKGSGQAFVVSEKRGTWGRAKPVPGLALLNTGGAAVVDSLSCASAGNCSAVGSYNDAHGTQAFVVSEKRGTWSRAKQVPGLALLNTGGNAEIYSLSCASAGNCSAGGYYSVGNLSYGFVVTEKHGTWGPAITVATPGS
jgi:hypothetical protein